jgi:hypothetical protein
MSTDTARFEPEHWRADGGDSPLARLDIPPALRDRTFEVACIMRVRATEGAARPWHELRVVADGELQWSRRIPTEHPAPVDGLEYRFRRHVESGRGLRLQAYSDCREGRRLALMIEAEEV